jgi:hypothetical protein
MAIDVMHGPRQRVHGTKCKDQESGNAVHGLKCKLQGSCIIVHGMKCLVEGSGNDVDGMECAVRGTGNAYNNGDVRVTAIDNILLAQVPSMVFLLPLLIPALSTAPITL